MLFPRDRTILSLCDHSGAWSAPYTQAGYRVVQIDLDSGEDVRLLEYPGPVWGILAAPPCDRFCRPSARLWEEADDNGETLDRLSIADACLRMVLLCRPRWWALENPPGRLTHWYGQHTMGFHPWHYAGWADEPESEAHTKHTYLWGQFNPPERRPVQPEPYPEHLPPGKRDRTSRMGAAGKRERAITPAGFARAFFAANP